MGDETRIYLSKQKSRVHHYATAIPQKLFTHFSIDLSHTELERLNLECQGEHSLECNLDTVAARNILKVALASQVAIQGAVECSSIDPFSEMFEMGDECMDPMRRVPTATGQGLQHIIECADGNGQCDVQDMIEMMEGKRKRCRGDVDRFGRFLNQNFFYTVLTLASFSAALL